VICNGDCKSDLIPDLQIVDEDLFQRAQKIMEKRTTHQSFEEFQDLYLAKEEAAVKSTGAKFPLLRCVD